MALSCDAVFAGAAQSHSANGYLTFDFRASIENSGTTITTPSLIDNSSWNSCGTSKCQASGGFTQPVDLNIPISNGVDGSITVPFNNAISRPAGHYTSVHLQTQSSLTFSTVGGSYYMQSFLADFGSRIYMPPGDYYINSNFVFDTSVSLIFTGDGPVRIFVNGSVELGFGGIVNNTQPENLLIYARDDITIKNQLNLKGYLYSRNGNVNVQFGAQVTGGVSAAGQIRLDNSARLVYSPNVGNADLGGLCGLPALQKWGITAASSGSTCADLPVTIRALDADGQVVEDYEGTVTLSTSTNHGNWKKTGTTVDAYGTLTQGNADSGRATYTFTESDGGDIRLLLSNARAETLTVTVLDSAFGVETTSSAITFSDNAFVLSTALDPLDNDLVAMRPHKIQVEMVRRDPQTGSCGVATGYNANQVSLWITRAAGDPGGVGPTVTASNTVVLPNEAPASNNVNLAFQQGVASFNLTANDVGFYSLNIRDASQTFADKAIQGATEVLVARPFGIVVSVSALPASVSSSGPVFRRAGEIFTVTVRAVGWQSQDDTNGDGEPDGHSAVNNASRANLANNTSLVSFGRETPRSSITVKADLIAPTGGYNPGLTASPFTEFTTGAASASNIRFDEVGIIELFAVVSGGDYFSSPGGAKILGRSSAVGRFIPDHFRLSDATLTPACQSTLRYSYLQQNFGISTDVTPYSANNQVLRNYIEDFHRFQLISSMLTASDLDSTTSLNDRIVVTANTPHIHNNGKFTVAPNVMVQRLAMPDGPFSSVKMGFRPVDMDGVTLRANDLDVDSDFDSAPDAKALHDAVMRLRFGRLRLDSAYGPETANLPVNFRTEYWDGLQWRQNREDDCTKIALSSIQYPDGNIETSTHRTVTLGAGSTTGQYAQLNSLNVGFNQGDAGHFFTAPGAGNTGHFPVKVDLTLYPWLQFDWNNDGNYEEAFLPEAQFHFGQYRGHDRVLYWMEY